MRLILATTSANRIEMFRKLWIAFEAKGSDVDEYAADRPSNPEALVKYLSKLKAEAVAKNHTEWIVVGFDTVGFFDGEILEKPQSREEAFARLQRMAGQNYSYITGIYIINLWDGKILSDTVETKITLRQYSEDEINYYLDNCNKKYKTAAHGFNTMDYYSMSFVESIHGDPFNIHWSPVSKIMWMLKEVGYSVI
jgi:septum formation protein